MFLFKVLEPETKKTTVTLKQQNYQRKRSKQCHQQGKPSQLSFSDRKDVSFVGFLDHVDTVTADSFCGAF